MKLQELYKFLNLIHESPDIAEFWLPIQGFKRRINKEFGMTEAFTFTIFGGVLFYARSSMHFHGDIMRIISRHILEGAPVEPEAVQQIGEFDENAVEEFKERCFMKNVRWDRTKLLGMYPAAIQGRTWKEDSFGLVSIWNDFKYLTPENINLIKQMIEEEYGTSVVYLEVENSDSILIDTLLHKIKPEIKNDVDTTLVHLASPEKKRQMLLNQGARPKTPVDIRQKQMLNAESVQRRSE